MALPLDFRLSELQEGFINVFDDIFHFRTTGGLDKRMALPNLRQSMVSYTEISVNSVAAGNASTVGKVQIFKNISGGDITLTLGAPFTSAITIMPNQAAQVLWNGAVWSFVAPFTEKMWEGSFNDVGLPRANFDARGNGAYRVAANSNATTIASFLPMAFIDFAPIRTGAVYFATNNTPYISRYEFVSSRMKTQLSGSNGYAIFFEHMLYEGVIIP